MNDLAAALEYYDANDGAFVMSHVAVYIAAARERLAQLESDALVIEKVDGRLVDRIAQAIADGQMHYWGNHQHVGAVYEEHTVCAGAVVTALLEHVLNTETV